LGPAGDGRPSYQPNYSADARRLGVPKRIGGADIVSGVVSKTLTEEPSYLDRSEWQKQFHLRLAKTIATIIVKRG
jgi:hypothetical protein